MRLIGLIESHWMGRMGLMRLMGRMTSSRELRTAN